MPTGSPRVDWLGSLNSLKNIDFATLRRSAAWASAAFIAVVGVIFAAGSESGSQRLQQALSGQEPPRATPVVAQIPAPQPELERLARRLSDTVQSLTAEREKLSARLASLERNLDDVTGSIKKPAEPAPVAATPAPPPMTIFTAVPPLPANSPAVWPAPPGSATARPEVSAPETTAAAIAKPDTARPDIATPGVAKPDAAGSDTAKSGTPPDAPLAPVVRIETPRGVPLPPTRAGRETTGSVAEAASEEAREQAHAEARGANQILGIDLGGARSIDALTIHWSGLKAKFGEQLVNLQPVVSIRERKPGVPELRLIAGPIAGVEAATKICMVLVTARAPCRPTQFSGQRLSQR
jgi:hypothetical protein